METVYLTIGTILSGLGFYLHIKALVDHITHTEKLHQTMVEAIEEALYDDEDFIDDEEMDERDE